MSPRDRSVALDYFEDHIELLLDRPPVNAFTVEMFEEFLGALQDIASDPRPLLIEGASGVFSAGLDIRAPLSDPAAADTAARGCVAALQRHASPTLSSVEGAAVGVGLLLATSSDFLVVAADARLRMPEITLGLDADHVPLRRYIPEPWIRRICLLGAAVTPEEISLSEAGAIVCEPGTSRQHVARLLAQLRHLDGDALGRMKGRLSAE